MHTHIVIEMIVRRSIARRVTRSTLIRTTENIWNEEYYTINNTTISFNVASLVLLTMLLRLHHFL